MPCRHQAGIIARRKSHLKTVSMSQGRIPVQTLLQHDSRYMQLNAAVGASPAGMYRLTSALQVLHDDVMGHLGLRMINGCMEHLDF